MADSVEVSTIETTDGTIGIIRDNAARQSIANLREGKETVGSVAWENVKGRPTKVSELENDKNYQTDENVSNTLNSTLYAGSSTHGGPATSADKLTTARTISLSGAAAGSGSFDGSANSTINVSSLDATKLTGVVPITNLPPSVIERMSIVKDDTERFALTKDKVQDGDVVKVKSSGLIYYVVDDDKLNEDAGYEVFTVGTAASVPWGGVTDKPSSYPPSSHTHTKSQITDFPSSLPSPSNLTMQIEGNNAAVYNGGTSQTFNVTKSSLGLDKVNNTADADKSVKYAASAGNANTATGHSLGLNIPSPSAVDQDKFLSGKGVWESITGKIVGTKVTSADTADKIATARNITIGSSSKKFDGSSDVSYSLSEIGAQPSGYYTTASQIGADAPNYTVDDIFTLRRGTTGGVGSVYMKQKSSGLGSEIPGGWYNYIYSPHRTGIGDDNDQYATVILCPMNFAGESYILRYSSGVLAEVTNLNSPNFLSASDKSKTVATVPYYSCDQLNSEFGTSGTDTETYLKNWVKKIVKSHSNLSGIVIIGTANPNAAGTIIFRAYECTNYNNTGFPQYCEGQYFGLWSSYHTFGTYDGVWNFNSFVLSNNLSINPTNYSVVQRSDQGWIYGTYFNQSSGDETGQLNSSSYTIFANSDGFLRKASVSALSSLVGGFKSAKYTLTASKWSGSSAPYSYDLGPTYGSNAIIGFDSETGTEEQLEAASAANIQGSSSTKIYAFGDKPTVDIPIVIIYQ